jgi:hypothetical protein
VKQTNVGGGHGLAVGKMDCDGLEAPGKSARVGGETQVLAGGTGVGYGWGGVSFTQ